MAKEAVAQLDPIQLERYREAAVERDLALAGHPGLSIEDARNACYDYYVVWADLISAHELPDDYYVIDPVTGSISEEKDF